MTDWGTVLVIFGIGFFCGLGLPLWMEKLVKRFGKDRTHE